MVACMWNYGELGRAETKKYVSNMLSVVEYKRDKIIDAILSTHDFIKEKIEISAVSLRDIERFRLFYQWFFNNLPNAHNLDLQNIFP